MPWLNVSNCEDDEQQHIKEADCKMQVDSSKVNEQACKIASKPITSDNFLERVQKLLMAW